VIKLKKGQKQWQRNAYLEAHDCLKKVLIEADKGMTKTELHKATGISRSTINKHLLALTNLTKEVQKVGNQYFWGDVYRAMTLGFKENAALTEELDVLTNRMKSILQKMSKPENLWKFKHEGQFVPKAVLKEEDSISLMTPEELHKMLEHQEKVFGELRRSFFNLAQILMKVDVGFITAEEDLSNIQVYFKNGEPDWNEIPESLKKSENRK
jgi:predicted transcriptional regulator